MHPGTVVEDELKACELVGENTGRIGVEEVWSYCVIIWEPALPPSVLVSNLLLINSLL